MVVSVSKASPGAEEFEQGHCLQCGDCDGTGHVSAPSFEVRKVADLMQGWDRYRALVAQRQYVNNGVWAEEEVK